MEITKSVFDTIKKHRKGITVKNLIAKTELEPRQVSNVLYRLTKEGRINHVERGIYAPVKKAA